MKLNWPTRTAQASSWLLRSGTCSFLSHIAGADAQKIWVQRGGFTSVNKKVSLDSYPDPVARKCCGGPSIESTSDFLTDWSRSFCQPCHVHGPVWTTFRRLSTAL